MKCKGIIAPEKGRVLMADIDVLPPVKDEVQVRMVSTLVSTGTERAWVHALENAVPKSYPYVPGYCCAGYVEAMGPEVSGFEVGDRVACYAVDVGHREIGNVPAYRVVHIPDGVSFDHAAFTSLGQTSLQGVRKCKIELGESVVSYGLGIVGLIALQFASLNGALPAIGLARSEERLEMAMQCGADAALDTRASDWRDKLRELTGGKGPNVVIENTGEPSVMTDACKIAADYARISILGCPRGRTDFNFYSEVQKKSISIIGAHAVDSIPRHYSYPNFWTFADDADCFLAFVKAGKFVIDPMIGEVVEKNEAERAYQRLMAKEINPLGMLIHW